MLVDFAAWVNPKTDTLLALEKNRRRALFN